MMSLNRMGLATVVKRQYQYKMKAYVGVFSSLIVLQCLAMLFSLTGSGSSGYSSTGFSIDITIYSGINIVIFTFLWAFIHSIIMTTKADLQNGFTFVSNRLSNNLSNAAFLLTASIIGGITTILSGFLLRVIVYFFIDTEHLHGEGFIYQPIEVISGMAAMVFYLILACSVGYLLGTITQLHRMLPVILPIAIIGFLIVTQEQSGYIFKIAEFYFQETSFLLFVLKVMMTSILCFVGSILLSNRLEVRK
ncbi:hypothetical protein ACFOUV_13675 [Oceanobacillus longus]|uniref:ABC transporter permease n=1 Tax=Oceanobacillus longus TaxID=930120 RepID=A0ABV8GY93_9BACI